MCRYWEKGSPGGGWIALKLLFAAHLVRPVDKLLTGIKTSPV